jgi:hypothetical protein
MPSLGQIVLSILELEVNILTHKETHNVNFVRCGRLIYTCSYKHKLISVHYV